ncbi:LPS O-antigen length regulator [Aliikangiella marina]|uniref:LPS O-antigen length regulator n=1 Tax=Aliikangiella marina TaxID=1712262 RepID=A0A545TIM4_9GAMM|nr:Wzz/FepE/Etk N-terminal domain-containing protein [Aliikangiella marina]TQV77026.1 LPS O-antigen length regulator [Aliikangiella marina]
MSIEKSTSVPSNQNEITLKEILDAFWEKKWIIIIVTSIFAISSVFVALNIPNQYKSTTILAPSSNSGVSGLSKLAGQFGGLASLAGINLSSGGSDDKSLIAIELIKTWGFLEKFIKEQEIQIELFAVEGWSLHNDKLLVNADLYDESQKKWVREPDYGKGIGSEPTSWELYKELKDRIEVSQDKNTGFIKLSLEYYSPKLAKAWLDKLVLSLNSHIQQKDREDALKSISYLQSQIKQTNINEMQAVFYQLIEEQTKTLMLTEVSDEYALKTISEPKVAEVRSTPNRALICIVSTIVGAFFSSLIVLIRTYIIK